MAVQIPQDQSSHVSEVIDTTVLELKEILATLTTENLGQVSRAIGVLETLSAMWKAGK